MILRYFSAPLRYVSVCLMSNCCCCLSYRFFVFLQLNKSLLKSEPILPSEKGKNKKIHFILFNSHSMCFVNFFLYFASKTLFFIFILFLPYLHIYPFLYVFSSTKFLVQIRVHCAIFFLDFSVVL